MRFWGREIAGWLLVLAGVGVLGLCVLMLVSSPPRLIEAGPLTVIGIIVFRGGIHLLKVAVAARICLESAVIPALHSRENSRARALPTGIGLPPVPSPSQAE